MELELDGEALRHGRGDRRRRDHPPPGDWTYRIGLAANWLNDPTRGDVLLISEPVRVDVR